MVRKKGIMEETVSATLLHQNLELVLYTRVQILCKERNLPSSFGHLQNIQVLGTSLKKWTLTTQQAGNYQSNVTRTFLFGVNSEKLASEISLAFVLVSA